MALWGLASPRFIRQTRRLEILSEIVFLSFFFEVLGL
jgi:hypothetical protein